MSMECQRTAVDTATVTRRAELAEHHRARLVAVARRRVDSAADAEDCVSEAILRCLTFPGLDEARIGEFLTAVTMRLCVDVHRRSAREHRALQRLGVVRHAHEPHEAICDQSEARWMLTQASALPPRESAVVQALVAGQRARQTAERLGVTPKAVECALRRARQRLRHAWLATLAVSGVAGLRRVLPRAASVVPVALSAAAAVTVMLPAPGHAAAPGVQPPMPRAASASSYQLVALPRREAPRPGAHRAFAHVEPRAASVVGRHSRLLAETGPVGDARIATVGGTTASRTAEDKSFLESVDDCLGSGPQVTAHEIGCPP